MNTKIDYIDEYGLRFLKQISLGKYKFNKKFLKIRFAEFRHTLVPSNRLREIMLTCSTEGQKLASKVTKKYDENSTESRKTVEDIFKSYKDAVKARANDYISVYENIHRFLFLLEKHLKFKINLSYEREKNNKRDYLPSPSPYASFMKWSDFLESNYFKNLRRKYPGLALWLADLNTHDQNASSVLNKEFETYWKQASELFYLVVKIRRISKDKIALFLNDYMQYYLRFNDNKARIYYGKRYCQFELNSIEHDIAAAIFKDRKYSKVHKNEIIDFVIKRASRREINNRIIITKAVRRINKKFIDSFLFVNELIKKDPKNSSSFWLNKDIVKV